MGKPLSGPQYFQVFLRDQYLVRCCFWYSQLPVELDLRNVRPSVRPGKSWSVLDYFWFIGSFGVYPGMRVKKIKNAERSKRAKRVNDRRSWEWASDVVANSWGSGGAVSPPGGSGAKAPKIFDF